MAICESVLVLTQLCVNCFFWKKRRKMVLTTELHFRTHDNLGQKGGIYIGQASVGVQALKEKNTEQK